MSITAVSINHFAVSVRNLDEAIEWYDKVLGFRLANKDSILGVPVKVAHMSGYGIQLELFEAENSEVLPDSRRHPNDDLMVQGNKHFSLTIPDRETAKKELKNLNVEIVMIADVNSTYGIFIHDPTGNLIELIEEM